MCSLVEAWRIDLNANDEKEEEQHKGVDRVRRRDQCTNQVVDGVLRPDPILPHPVHVDNKLLQSCLQL